MERRQVLMAGGAVAAATVATGLGWPGWLRRAFASGHATLAGRSIEPEPTAEPCPGAMRKDLPAQPPGPVQIPSGREVVWQAVRRGQAEQKKVLILVIPRQQDASFHLRGQAIGEFLNHGSDAALAPLARAVVACATVDDVQQELGVKVAGEPLMLVHDPLSHIVMVRELAAALPPVEFVAEKPEPPSVGERIAIVGKLVAQGLGAAPASEVTAWAAQVREQIVKKRPPGGQWGSATGCGTHYEEGPRQNDNGLVACGMGQVPERSKRFLAFLTRA